MPRTDRRLSGSRRGVAQLALAALVSMAALAMPARAAEPASVTVAGSLQSELGCSEDWQPACAATHLAFDAGDGVWQGTFSVPAGSFEYKAALDDSWTENYGAHAMPNGANIPLDVAADRTVKFYYSPATHWVTDNVNSVIAVAPGSFQSKLGCPGDWQPDCLRSWLQDPDGDGVYTFSTRALPAGSYEVKVALDESWSVNYGAGGVQSGPNIGFTVAADCEETLFSWDSTTHVLTVGPAAAAPQPASVTIAGSFQSEVGCSGDWQPDCASTDLTFFADDGVWQGTFDLPAGSYEYKAALDHSWAVNYGANATPGGSNIALSLADPAAVKFYYSHATHWVTDGHSAPIAVAPGSFQSELGCPGDWQPDCLRSWLQDPDGDGRYTFSAFLPAGSWEAKVALGESWAVNYGAGGVQDGANIAFTVARSCVETFFTWDATTHELTIGAAHAPAGNLALARAHWLSRDTIAWKPGAAAVGGTVFLHHDADADLALGDDGVTGGEAIPLVPDPQGLSEELVARFPHLAGFAVWHLPADALAEVPDLLKEQLAVSAIAADGTLVDATSLQIPGVLDDVYRYDGPLGPTFAGRVPTLRLWAPTARSVTLQLFASSRPEAAPQQVAMALDAATGVWSVRGEASWNRKFYLYDVDVYVPSTRRFEHNLVTDPYSLSLGANSTRSQIVDLEDPDLQPPGWRNLEKPALPAPEDIALYELHVRDFSITDESVPEAWRGTYRAFALQGSDGMRHLRALAHAGLTHVHLLPAFDFATVPERRADQVAPAGDLASFAPDSEEPQARVAEVADQDGFNWGYDPFHFTTPEGSYATDPDGPQRIREFREMVQGLAKSGLRTVMDVVYNHTTAAGENERSVLDRVVPGYYHRLNLDGGVENSTCCANTAPEHRMMGKLVVDSLLTWAREYKVDGFRFDLMGDHPKANILAAQAALHALTPSRDGVDGSAIYLYGEGWNFGEVANDARFVQATQLNMAGTGVGSFDDRERDGARGGGPFSGPQEQGFLTGLFYDPNATDQGDAATQLATLLHRTDWIRVGLAGALGDFRFEDARGETVAARQIDYQGQPAGYTADPQEVINYVEAHDNETLFDAIQLKAPVERSTAERTRMQNLGIDLLALGQGVPFFHAGVELLRSKSLDRNSYDSGDWFNRIDWDGVDSTWGSGLPPARDNQAQWPLDQALLANPELEPTPADMMAASVHMIEMLRIRSSSRLFRLRTAAEVAATLHYHNTGPAQLPGVLAWSLDEADGTVDRRTHRIVVVVNANDEAQTVGIPGSAGHDLRLHPVQAASFDPVVHGATFSAATGTITVPPRTTAVFVEGRSAREQLALSSARVEALIDGAALPAGDARPLLGCLAQASTQLERGRRPAAREMLRTAVRQVERLAQAGRLDAALADELAAGLTVTMSLL